MYIIHHPIAVYTKVKKYKNYFNNRPKTKILRITFLILFWSTVFCVHFFMRISQRWYLIHYLNLRFCKNKSIYQLLILFVANWFGWFEKKQKNNCINLRNICWHSFERLIEMFYSLKSIVCIIYFILLLLR